jgi:hypothetical protein
MTHGAVHQQFTAALDALVARVKEDRSVLAAILCGSLSHDTVWARSDIDLVLVTIDDRKVPLSDLALSADGVNVHTMLIPRAAFRQTVEGSVHNSFMHSFLAKGRLLYTHDPTIAALCERLHTTGTRDAAVQLLRAATHALAPLYKAHKWWITRGDLEYTALWILYAATPLAQIEVISAGQLVGREVIPQAMGINPALLKTIYVDLLNAKKTPEGVEAALDAVDEYLSTRARSLFSLVIDHLRETGDVRSSSDLDDHFRKNFDVSGVTAACEYLADQGLIGKAAAPVQLTRRSNVQVEELAFYFTATGG